MNFDDLFKKENKKLCRWLGIICVTMPSLYILGGGFIQGFEGLRGWFREWFVFGLSIMFMLGIVLSAYGFIKQKDEKE